jgi:hypothetical protein
VSFAAPLWLAVAGVVAAGLILAHLISTSVPRRDPFPTARFIPEGAPLTVLRTRRLTDVALLLLRLLAVALLGLALAGARVAKGGPTRVVLADRSRAVADQAEVNDSVAALGNAVVVSFDSGARVSALGARPIPTDSGQRAVRNRPQGSLSGALVLAHRTLADATKDRDKTELVIVSPLVREEIDSATAALLQLWEGPVRVVRVSTASDTRTQPVVRASGDDPVVAALGGSGAPSAERGKRLDESRIVRDAPTTADSLWARDSGGALVIWPAVLATSALRPRLPVDTALGVGAERHVVVGTFERTHQPADGAVLARWLDGTPAATEVVFGKGCVREVAIPVDRVGDIALRDNFRALARRFSEPCGGARDFTAVELSALRSEPGEPSPRTGSDPRASSGDSEPSRLALWLALAALALLMAEQLLRRRPRVA